MKSAEFKVAEESEYYIFSPSKIAVDTFFYPTYIGQFMYRPGYQLKRHSFNSFLLIYIRRGFLHVEQEGFSGMAREGQFVLLDCFRPHGYDTKEGCDTLWLHFDGANARAFYELIVSKLGNLFSMDNPSVPLKKMNGMLKQFASDESLQEAQLSKMINDILTEFLLYTPFSKKEADYGNTIEDIVYYISKHLVENISIEDMAKMASLSVYHFIRVFKKETGYTPHDYIVNMRIHTAKYLLTNTAMTVKEVCFQIGFSNESVFSASFKKRENLSPSEYRAITVGQVSVKN